MSLEIRRKGNKNFTHIDSDFNNEYGANDITIIFEGNTVKLRSFNGRIIFKINGYDLSVITIYDDTASGSQENFNDINLFKQRLINLGYPFAGGSVSGGGIPEAPNDGQQYGRQSEGWSVVTGGSGSGSVPSGGLENQILKKSSNTDYDYEWGANVPSISSDADNIAVIGTDGGLFVPQGIPDSGSANLRYIFASATNPQEPTANTLQINNVDLSLATEIYFSSTAYPNRSVNNILELLKQGDALYLQQSSDDDFFINANITGEAVDNGSFFTIPIEIATSGQPFNPNSFTDLIVYHSGGGNGNPTTGLSKAVNQVGHGFSVGNVIRLDGSNYVKAQADSVNNANAISFVVSVTDADNFVLQSEGYTTASLGLSNGDEAFLSTTVLGGIQTTEPTNGEINLYLGQQTPQGFLISISTGFVVGGGSSGVDIVDPRINLPAQIYASQGVELNVYFDSIVFPCDKGLSSPSEYRVEAICSVGKSDEKRFYITPSIGDVGVYVLTFNVYSLSGQLLESKNVSLGVLDVKGLKSGLNALFLGDSLTAWGDFPQNFRDNNPVNTPVFWGTQGSSPNNHEGRGGWSTSTFLNNSTSPIINNGVLDIANYRNNLGLTEKFDFVSFMLGVNDCFSNELDDTEINQIVNNYKLILDAFIIDSPDANLFVQLPTIDSNTSDGWAFNYGADSSKIEYQKNIWKLRELMINEFDLQNYNSNVLLGYAGITVDRYYGYPFTSQNVSDRITTQIERHSNAVHPSNEGFSQLGDGMFSMVLYNLDQQTYGSEIFLDTDFSEPASMSNGWITNDDGVSIDTVTKELKFIETQGSNMRAYATNGSDFNILEYGKTYKLEYSISAQTSLEPDTFLRAFLGSSGVTTIDSGIGSYSMEFTQGASGSRIFQFVLLSYTDGNELYISNASLKEVL